MDYAVLVRCRHRICYLKGYRKQFLKLESALGYSLCQCLAGDVFENQVAGPLILLDDLVDHSDIRVIQRGQKFGLTPKTHPSSRVTLQFGRHALDGDRAVKLGVMSQIDYPYAPPADHFSYFEVTDFPADKIISGCCFCEVGLIGLDQACKQHINFAYI